jgi:hypothetical protein
MSFLMKLQEDSTVSYHQKYLFGSASRCLDLAMPFFPVNLGYIMGDYSSGSFNGAYVAEFEMTSGLIMWWKAI